MIYLSDSQEQALKMLTDGFSELTETMKKPIIEFSQKINDNLVSYIENYMAINISNIVREAVKEHLMAILSGNMQVLERLHIFSEYDFGYIHEVRKKIWEDHAPDIANSLIRDLQNQIQSLKEDNECLRNRYRNLY